MACADASGIDAWVPVGMMVPFAAPPRMPVLDVVAERDFPGSAVERKVARRRNYGAIGCSAELVVDATDHYFDGAAGRLAAAIAPFIARALAGACKN